MPGAEAIHCGNRCTALRTGDGEDDSLSDFRFMLRSSGPLGDTDLGAFGCMLRSSGSFDGDVRRVAVVNGAVV